jgi:transcriptional repressor NrdR
LDCKQRFTTYEKIELPRFSIIKRNREIESYDRNKITKGIRLALEKRPFTDDQIDGIIDDIEQDLIAMGQKEIKSQQVGDIVISKLQELDDVAYLRFISVYKSFNNANRFIKEADKLSKAKK